MAEVFKLERVAISRRAFGHRIVGPDGMQYGPTFSDTNGPREAAPWLRALGDAFRAGQVAENLRCTPAAELREGDAS